MVRVEVEAVGPPHPETFADWVWGQSGGAPRARRQMTGAVLVASKRRTLQLWVDKGTNHSMNEKKRTRKQLQTSIRLISNSHFMSFTTSWWDMEDTNEPFTCKTHGDALKNKKKSTPSRFNVCNRKESRPLWSGPPLEPQPWLLPHLRRRVVTQSNRGGKLL